MPALFKSPSATPARKTSTLLILLVGHAFPTSILSMMLAYAKVAPSFPTAAPVWIKIFALIVSTTVTPTSQTITNVRSVLISFRDVSCAPTQYARNAWPVSFLTRFPLNANAS